MKDIIVRTIQKVKKKIPNIKIAGSYTFLFLLIILIVPIFSFSENNPVSFPLDFFGGITSTFGEYRGNRFHAGFDLSTDHRTGFPVTSVRSGEIYRLKIKRRGYGRTLYIRHHDGTESVYAHLQSFDQNTLNLEDIVAKYRKKRETFYPGSIYLKDPIPVKRDQLIGYSGESGAGYPHLHLEFRKNTMEPFNFFRKFYGELLEDDNTAPKIHSITATPGNSRVKLDGNHKAKTFDPSKRKFLSATGNLQLSTTLYEEQRTHNRCGIDKLKLYRNNNLLVSMAFKRFSFTNNRKGGLIYDLAGSNLSPTVLKYLLTGYHGGLEGIVQKSVKTLNIKEGINIFRLEAYDTMNNKSSVTFHIFKPSGNFRLKKHSVADDSLVVKYENSTGKPVQTFDINTCSPGKRTSINSGYEIDRKKNTLRIPLSETDICLRIRPVIKNTPLDWSLIDLRKKTKNPEPSVINISTNDKFCRLYSKFDSIPRSNPVLNLNRKEYNMHYSGGTEYETAIPLSDLKFKNKATLNSTEKNQNIKFYRLKIPANGKKINNLLLSTAQARFFGKDKFLILMKSTRKNNFKHLKPVSSSVYKFEPFGKPLKSPLTVKYNGNAGKRAGLYLWNFVEEKWSYGGKKEHPLETDFNSLTKIAVFKDVFTPELKAHLPRRGDVLNKKPDGIKIIIEEKGAGIDHRTAKFRINGKEYKGDYDPDRSELFPLEKIDYQSGENTVKFRVSDYADNTLKGKWKFRINSS